MILIKINHFLEDGWSQLFHKSKNNFLIEKTSHLVEPKKLSSSQTQRVNKNKSRQNNRRKSEKIIID